MSAVLAVAALLTACGEEPEPELSGHFGAGSGAATTGPYLPISITTSSGSVVGTAEYDSFFFDEAFGPSSSSEFKNLADDPATATIVVTLARITGRPDTPCRFQAGILARDENYDILESGDRQNSRDLDFYQVNLKKGSLRLSLFCVTLGDDVGTVVQVVTQSAALIHSRQVHYILNSIRKD